MDEGAERIRFYKIKNQWTSFSKFQAIEEESNIKIDKNVLNINT